MSDVPGDAAAAAHRRPGRGRLVQIAAGVSALIVLVVLVLVFATGGTSSPHPPTTSVASGSSTTTSAGPTIPFVGVAVAVQGQPVTGPGGKRITIADSAGHELPITGVVVKAVQPTVPVADQTSPAPGAGAGLKAGDVIWGVSEVQSTQFTEVTSGAVLSAFFRSYASSGHSDSLYLYYYDPAADRNHETDPAQVAPVQVPGSVSAIDCTATSGC